MEKIGLSRIGAVKKYEEMGLHSKGKVLKGKELRDKLCSLFFTRFKQTLSEENIQKLRVYYADMMEIITDMMAKTRTQFKNPFEDKNQQALQWYKGLTPAKIRLKEARIDLMQKFYEFTNMKTEAVRDQLNEMLTSLHNVIVEHGLNFDNVKELWKKMHQMLGEFAVDIKSVSRIKVSATGYSK